MTPTRILNVSNVELNEQEILLLAKGLSFCPTAPPNLDELNNDLFRFSRILRLKYHFRDSNFVDTSIIKLPSTYHPKVNECAELECMIRKLLHLNVKPKYPPDNIKSLRGALQSLINKTQNNEIIIKPADKGDVTVIMSPDFYEHMCMVELSKQDFYQLVDVDPTQQVMDAINAFASRYERILTSHESAHLTDCKYSMAHFYMLPKLHKSQFINNCLGHELYVHLVNFQQDIEGRPIVGGPRYHTSGISKILDSILQPIVSQIDYILKDSFDLVNRAERNVGDDVLLGTCDIKSLYTNISQDLAMRAIDFWVSKYEDSLPSLQRFSKQFILDALFLIMNFNFFKFNNTFYKQIKGFAMGTKAAVSCANLVVAFLEARMFALLPTIYPQDVVDFIIRHYFRFLDDIVYRWLIHFDVTQFYQIFNSLDEDLQFIFSLLSTEQDFMDINFRVVDNNLVMDIYYKPTNSFNYLNYSSSHPRHTRDNIALSLAKRIVRIVDINREQRLGELKTHLMLQDHPSSVIDYAFTKVFQPRKAVKEDLLIFTYTHNPSHQFNYKVFTSLLDNLKSRSMKKAFGGTNIVMGTRQTESLHKLLVSSRYPPQRPLPVSNPGFHRCRNGCIYHRDGYLPPCKSFQFGPNLCFTWEYTRWFDCNCSNVIYILICGNCGCFYIGETGNFKERCSLHKSNAKHPENSNCKTLSFHLKRCTGLKEPYFRMYPIFFVANQHHRRFIEKRFIHKYKPELNGDR